MKKIILVVLICLFSIIAVEAKEVNQTQQGLDNQIDELMDPVNSNIQPNGSDIQPEKVYSQEEYEQIYQDLQVPTFQFIHGIDPDQYYDMKDTAWSPYPLMRLNSPIYFKSLVILPGYYLLTPRQYKGDWYILFKESGKVKYIIPAFDRNYTDPMYYHNHLKEVDMKFSQKHMVRFLDGFGKVFRRSKRRPPIKTNLELTDLDNKFMLLDLYYGSYHYKTIFRTDKF